MGASRKGGAFAALFLTFFFWGSVYVGGKLVSSQCSPFLLACLRCVVAMLPLLLMARKHLGVKIDPADRKYFLAVGILGYFLTITLVQAGISLTGASTASLINAMTPVGVTVLAAVLLKEKITPVKCLCLALALGGTVIITSGASSQSDALGIVLVLISVVSWSFASVFMRRLTAKYPPILVTTYGMALSLALHIPVGIFTSLRQPPSFTLPTFLVVLYLGLVGSGLSQFTWTYCLSRLPASTCSMFYPLQPAFSALLGALILSETFTAAFWVGMVLISADVLLSTWETRRLTRLEEAEAAETK